ncbi:hypothetical protein FXO37_14793, partial [Capsicum annuum]
MIEIFSKCSYSNIGPTAKELEKVDLPRTSFAFDHHDTSSMSSSTENQYQRNYRVNLPQVTKDHDSFDDFSMTPPQFLMRKSMHVSRKVFTPLSKSGKDVRTGRRSYRKEQRQIRNAKKKQTVDTEEKSKVDADSTCINKKNLLIKADLDSLESEIKTYVKTYIDQKFKDLKCVMNERFYEVLKSLQQKKETVEKENILKQSPQEGDPSDDVVDDARPTSTDSLVKEADKLVEMEEDKANITLQEW